jgi:hypothetical protein
MGDLGEKKRIPIQTGTGKPSGKKEKKLDYDTVRMAVPRIVLPTTEAAISIWPAAEGV